MRLGLVVVTYESAGLVPRLMAAIAAQHRRPDRVVVVDNGSRDGTAAAVTSAARASGVDVSLMALSSNTGFAAANNRAVAALDDCDCIALLNPDAFPEPEWLVALTAAADRHPTAGSFASRLMRDGAPGVLDGAGDVYHVSGVVWRHGHGQPLTEVPGALDEREVFSACAAAALYRRADWISVGGFDERYFCYVEDVDLGFRLQLHGRPCWYVPDAVAWHVGSAVSGVGSTFAIYHGHRNATWTLVKNMPASLLWRAIPAHLAATVAGVVWFAARGQAAAFLRARRDAMRDLPAVWRARRARPAPTTDAVTAIRDRVASGSLVRHWRARRAAAAARVP